MSADIPAQTGPDIDKLLGKDSNSAAICETKPKTDQNAELDEEFATIMQRHGRTVEALTNR